MSQPRLLKISNKRTTFHGRNIQTYYFPKACIIKLFRRDYQSKKNQRNGERILEISFIHLFVLL